MWKPDPVSTLICMMSLNQVNLFKFDPDMGCFFRGMYADPVSSRGLDPDPDPVFLRRAWRKKSDPVCSRAIDPDPYFLMGKDPDPVQLHLMHYQSLNPNKVSRNWRSD